MLTISQKTFTLRLFKRLKVVKRYKVAVGQPMYPTPRGRYSIVSKQVNPVWSVPNSPWAGELAGTTVDGGSAANPLKARWMGIVDGVGIHGTGEDGSIGYARLTWLHPHARLRRHRALQARAGRDARADRLSRWRAVGSGVVGLGACVGAGRLRTASMREAGPFARGRRRDAAQEMSAAVGVCRITPAWRHLFDTPPMAPVPDRAGPRQQRRSTLPQ